MSHIGSKIDPSIPVLIGIKFPVMTRHQGAQYVVKILSVEVESYIGQRLWRIQNEGPQGCGAFLWNEYYGRPLEQIDFN